MMAKAQTAPNLPKVAMAKTLVGSGMAKLSNKDTPKRKYMEAKGDLRPKKKSKAIHTV